MAIESTSPKYSKIAQCLHKYLSLVAKPLQSSHRFPMSTCWTCRPTHQNYWFRQRSHFWGISKNHSGYCLYPQVPHDDSEKLLDMMQAGLSAVQKWHSHKEEICLRHLQMELIRKRYFHHKVSH